MKVLLDEFVPVQVRNGLVGHDVSTVQQMGWGGISNGELLQRRTRRLRPFHRRG